jgi:carbonic anhydrase
MKRIALPAIAAAALILSLPASATDEGAAEGRDISGIVNFIDALKAENLSYASGRRYEYFNELTKGQYPIATVVTCSDSRVQSNMLHAHPEGRLYMVRNIGNQLATARGSVEYGVRRLHTPLLLFIGHSRCGAITAASGNYEHESPAIRRELDSIVIDKSRGNLEGVKSNLHHQVAAAMTQFAYEVKNKHLVVIGGVLDFADEQHEGSGKFNIIDVNGETDPADFEAQWERVLKISPATKFKPITNAASQKIAVPNSVQVLPQEREPNTFRYGLETHSTRSAYAGTFNDKNATARFIDLVLGLNLNLGNGYRLDIGASSGFGKHNLYRPVEDQAVRHNSIGFTLGAQFWQNDQTRASYFAGYKSDTTKMAAAGQAWKIDKIEAHGLLGGVDLRYREQESTFGLVLEGDFLATKWSDDSGYNALSKNRLGSKLALNYSYRFSPSLAIAFDYSRQAHRYDYTTFKVNRSDRAASLSVQQSF